MFQLMASACERLHRYQNFSQKPEFIILTVLAGVASHYGKDYCFPAQDKIVELLGRYGRKMSRRTFNRHINTLEEGGWIKRQRRHFVDPQNGMQFRSTLYMLTRRTFRWLSGLKDAVSRAVKWGSAFSRNTRVTTSAQHIPSRDSYTGCTPPKSGGAPPGNSKDVSAELTADILEKHSQRIATLRGITHA